MPKIFKIGGFGWRRLGDLSLLQWIFGGTFVSSAALGIWSYYASSPLLAQIALGLGVIAFALGIYVLILYLRHLHDLKKATLPKLKFSIIHDNEPTKAINRRVAVFTDDKSIQLRGVFVRITRFEPTDGSEIIRAKLVNIRRMHLMWTGETSDQPSGKVDGDRGLPVSFDFMKQITNHPFARVWLYVCHGGPVDTYDPKKHADRSIIRHGRFVRRRREEIPKHPYEVTLAATADNAETLIQDFQIRMENDVLVVTTVDSQTV